MDGSIDGMGLLVSGDGTDTDAPTGPIVTHAVLYDSDLARAVVDHHRKVCIYFAQLARGT